MENWTQKSDDEVFGGASEQPGSQAAYWRDTEIRRRLYLLEKSNLELAQKVLDAQVDAADQQRLAVDQMKRQSQLMFFSVIGVFLTALVTFGASIIN